MNAHKLLVAAALGFTSLVGFSVVQPSTARAQSSTTGAIRGVVTDKATGEKLAAVTVLVTSPALSQTQSTLTDSDGFYIVNELPPGDYLVTFFYLDFKVEQSGVHVGVNKASNVYQKFDLAAVSNKGETIHVSAKAPLVDTDEHESGHHARQAVSPEHPGPGPHVRRGARCRRRFAERRRRRVVLRQLVAREPVHRRRRQHDGPDARHGRLPGRQRLHRRDRGHHRWLQRRVRSRDRRRRQRRHEDRLERVQGLGVGLLPARVLDRRAAPRAGQRVRRSTRSTTSTTTATSDSSSAVRSSRTSCGSSSASTRRSCRTTSRARSRVRPTAG